jgi:hypothetical protein
MNLNKLPVLIRTEVTAAAKSASLPAVYSRALQVLEEAVEELSFAKLKTVEVSAEGLAAWAKAHQDEKLTKTARELKFRARRTANYIAEKLAAQRKAAFVSRGGVLRRGGSYGFCVPSGEPESGGPTDILHKAGYKGAEVLAIQMAAKLPDTPASAQLGHCGMRAAVRGKGRNRSIASSVYYEAFTTTNAPLRNKPWFRNNSARGIARKLDQPIEIEKARATVILVHAWCDEFLKNLPRNVSKAKV